MKFVEKHYFYRIKMEGTFRSIRDPPPSHLTFRIESFSTLSSSSLDQYELCEFKAGDRKWKLALYPNGNKSRGVKDHISLYLVLVDHDEDDLEKGIYVNFGFLLFDHQRRKYLSVQSLARFDEVKLESGFDEFLSHKIFMDPSSGYLEDDTCVFGAEVFPNEPRSHYLSMSTTKPAPFKYTWKLEKFSKLEEVKYYSEIFTTRGHDWKLCLYPKGNGTEKGNSVSLYVRLADSEALLPDGKNVLVEYKLRIINQVGSEHAELVDTRVLNSTGRSLGMRQFLNLSDLAGYLVNDTCVVEVEVTVLGSSK